MEKDSDTTQVNDPTSKDYANKIYTKEQTRFIKIIIIIHSEDASSSELPDYLFNPSRYTHYSLNSFCELHRASNTQPCKEFLQQIKEAEVAAVHHACIKLMFNKLLKIFREGRRACDASYYQEIQPCKQIQLSELQLTNLRQAL